MKSLNRSGMSLVEMLVAIGVMGIMALVMAQIVDNNTKQIKFLESKLEQNNVITFAQIAFNDPVACISNFQNINIPSGSMAAGQEIVLPRNLMRLGSVLVQDYKVSNFELGDLVFKVDSTTTGSDATGTLKFNFLPKAGAPPGIALKTQGFPMYLAVNAAGNIVNCPRPSAAPLATGGIAPVNMSSGGSYTQALPPGVFSSPPLIMISPLWSRFSGDEDTAWWVSNVTTTSFTINWAGPGGGSNHGTNGVMWKAEAY